MDLQGRPPELSDNNEPELHVSSSDSGVNPPSPPQPPPSPPTSGQPGPPEEHWGGAESGWQPRGSTGPWAGPQHRPVVYGPPVPGAVVVDNKVWLPAGFMPRFLAFLLDWALLGILHTILVTLIGIPQPDLSETMRLTNQLMQQLMTGGGMTSSVLDELYAMTGPSNLSYAVLITMCAAYYVIFHGMLGATAGKLVLGLRVLGRNGQPIGFGVAALRYVIYYLTGWLAYTGWLIWFTPEKRTAHDFAAGTNVFKAVQVD